MPAAPVLRVGWLQLNLAWQDPPTNIAEVQALLAKKPGEAEVWVLPEMWSTGFALTAEGAESEPGPALTAMQHWAAQHQALFIGSLKITHNGHLYNRAYVVQPDGTYFTYDKRHLFRMAGEERLFTAGRTRVVVEWKGWRLAPLICYDLRFPVWSRRSPTYDYDVLVYVANWPAARHAHWAALLPARAIENQAYVLGVNRLGIDGKGHLYAGGSTLYDPQGRLLLSSGEAAGAFTAALSYEALQHYRETFPAWQDADKFTLQESSPT